MGTLKPGATYVYEHADGVTYAREFGQTERFPIGWEVSPKDQDVYKSIAANYHNSKLWKDVLKEAETNPALQKALDNVIMLYRLSKDNPL